MVMLMKTMNKAERDKILIVDEDSNYIAGLRKSLNQAGYDVLSFDDPYKAMEIINDIRPQMIIADVEITETNDYSFFKHIQEIPSLKNIPFIALSNQKRVDDRIRTIELGVDDFISKPFYVEEVVARVENLFKEITDLSESAHYNNSGFGGNLSDQNLIDIISSLRKEQKTAVIHLRQGTFEGSVYIYQGELYDADFNDYHGMDALNKFFTWNEGRFFIEFTTFERTQTIHEPTEAILSGASEYTQEWQRIQSHLPSLITPVHLAKATAMQNNISDDERRLVANINGNTTLYEIVIKSPFDDIKALQLIHNLYEKGYLLESDTTLAEEKKKITSLFQNNLESHAPHLLSYLLQHPDESDAKPEKERRTGEDRRQPGDRRRLPDRRLKNRFYHQKIYLDKTELKMIREKLS